MKKLIFLTLLLSIALPASAQTAQGTAQAWMNPASAAPNATLTTQKPGVPGTVSGYQPLEPLKGTFNGTTYTSFADYLATIYKLTITIGALIAVVMLVTGGARYMLSESFTDKNAAKARIINALWGLVILVGSFLILYTINPNLLNFNLALPNANQNPSTFVPANSSGSAPANTYARTSIVPTLQYSDQNSNDPATSKSISNFILQCQQQGGVVIKTAGSDPNTTADTCQPTAGLY